MGETVELKGDQVAIRLENGKVRNLPLAVFRNDEQARIKLECGKPNIPNGLRLHYAFAQRQIKRAHLLEQQGVIDAEECTTLCDQARKAFRLSARKFLKNGCARPKVIEHLIANL